MGLRVRRVKTASGATAVQVVDYRDGVRRIVDHVGSGHCEVEVLALTHIAEERIHAGQVAFDLSGPAGRTVGPVVEGVASRVLWEVLEASYLRLGFDVVGDEAFKQLVLARIVEPTSKVDSLRVISELGIQAMSRSTMTRCLPKINKEDYRSQIATACLGLSSFLCKRAWSGLEVGVDPVGVGEGELFEGLFPVRGGIALDEPAAGLSSVGG